MKEKLSGFWGCVLYAAVLGVLSFMLGRIVPKTWFKSDKFPYRVKDGEKKVFDFLKVKKWQAKVPDMSRIFSRIMPEKRITADTLRDVPRMLQETCVAEFTHAALSICGLGMLFIWPGVGGVVAALVYILVGNLPFVIIQRYNRPRLQKLYDMQQRKKGANK